MKRSLRIAMPCLLALILAAGPALAANDVREVNDHYEKASTGAKTDSYGNAHTREITPLSDQNLTFTSIIDRSPSSTILTLGAADSSAVLDTHRMRLGSLLLKVTPSTGANTVVRLAVQIRTHLGGLSDSSSVFPVYLYSLAPVAAGIDSSNTGHLTTGSASAAWSGEFVVTVNGNRNSPGSAVAATAFSYPNGLLLPLQSDGGREFYSPWTSVRIRILSGPSCYVTAHLIGAPL